jgi:exodeoxyribonuclease VII small subunit
LTNKTTSKKKVDFDGALKQLESIVKDMEQGELGLEQSLKQFEKGILIAQDCQKRLNEAQLHVETLINEPSN